MYDADMSRMVLLLTGTPVEARARSEQPQATESNKVAPAPFDHLHLNGSHRASFCPVSAQGDHGNAQGVAQPSSSLSPGLRGTLRSLGVTDEAFAGWEAFHESPVRAMLYFFIPVTVMLAAFSYLQCAGIPLHRLRFTAPCLCTIGYLIGCIAAFWRYGPAVAKSRPYFATLPLAWISCSITIITR
jgi:hypothetical protein